MKKIIISFFYLLFASMANAQSGIDNRWLLGYGGVNGAMNIDFISGTPNVYSVNRQIPILEAVGIISDTVGNLLFCSNGCYITNSLNDTMQNGDALNPGACNDDYCISGNTIFQGNIVIPDPGNQNRYYLFHETCDYNTTPFYSPSKLYYSIIDMSLQGGLGSVIQKNIVIVNNNTLTNGFLTATKHANGRDWWIVVHNLLSNKFNSVLLTPYGLQGPFTQFIGPVPPSDGGGRSTFSPDGTKLATSAWYYPTGFNIYLFDFDRCTGLFSNPLLINVFDSIGACGVAFSPNSRFLYVTPLDSVMQYDMSASNIAASEVKVATRDSLSFFHFAELAYNNKIYIIGGDSVFSTIDKPDSLGLACNVIPHNVHLPHRNQGTVPNYPNYRLGAVAGSVCDSLSGVNEVNGFHLSLNVYPNPSASGIFYFHFNDIREQVKELEITDITGRVVYAVKKNIYEVNITAVASGIYFYKVKTKAGKIFNGKLVKQ